MDKKKIDMNKYADMHEDVVVTGKDLTDITVRNHISYSDKDAMAVEMIQYTARVHDDSIVYMGYDKDKIKLYLIAKYYTDIDTTDVDVGDVANYFINNEMIDKIFDIIGKDFEFVMDMYYMLYDATADAMADDKSIGKALRTSFGFLFNGEDVTESLAKAEAMKDTIYEAIGALRKVEKEREKNINNGTMAIDGALLNFAKKEE